jgi:hypothetical protein
VSAQFGPSCSTSRCRAEHLLVALPSSEDLLPYAKDLFLEATKQPPDAAASYHHEQNRQCSCSHKHCNYCCERKDVHNAILKCEKHAFPSAAKMGASASCPSLEDCPGVPNSRCWPQLADRPLCVAEWQEALSLPQPKAEHPLVALTKGGDLFIYAKYFFVEATVIMEG